MVIKNKNKSTQPEDTVLKIAEETLNDVQQVVDTTGQQIERTMAPVRKSISKCFPTMFLLLVTFGFTATVTGIEQILVQYDVLQTHPLAILIIGIGTLVLTGTLYKKLG